MSNFIITNVLSSSFNLQKYSGASGLGIFVWRGAGHPLFALNICVRRGEEKTPFIGLLDGLAFSRVHKVSFAFQAAVYLVAEEEHIYWTVWKSVLCTVFSCWIIFFFKLTTSYIVVFYFLLGFCYIIVKKNALFFICSWKLTFIAQWFVPY